LSFAVLEMCSCKTDSLERVLSRITSDMGARGSRSAGAGRSPGAPTTPSAFQIERRDRLRIVSGTDFRAWSPRDLAAAAFSADTDLDSRRPHSALLESLFVSLRLDGESLLVLRGKDFESILHGEVGRNPGLWGSFAGEKEDERGELLAWAAPAWKALRKTALSSLQASEQKSLSGRAADADAALGARSSEWWQELSAREPGLRRLLKDDSEGGLDGDNDDDSDGLDGKDQHASRQDDVVAAVARSLGYPGASSDVLRYFHLATSNTRAGGARTLSRDWQHQPACVRRYFGASFLPLDSFEEGGTGADLAKLFRAALAVSSRKSTIDILRSPRGCYSKRVEASSGGLHPVECYVLTSGVNSDSEDSPALFHYSPAYHGLEEIARFATSTSKWQSRTLCFFSLVWYREIWKYGERGLRYSLLDLGHAVGSVGLAARAFGWTLRPADVDLRTCNELLFGSDSGGEAGERCVYVLELLTDSPVSEGGADDDDAGISSLAKSVDRHEVFTSCTAVNRCNWFLADHLAEFFGAGKSQPRLLSVPNLALAMPKFLDVVRSRRTTTAFGEGLVDKSLFESLLGLLSDASPLLHVGVFVINVSHVKPSIAHVCRSESEGLKLGLAAGDDEGVFPRLVDVSSAGSGEDAEEPVSERVVRAHCNQTFLQHAAVVFHFYGAEDTDDEHTGFSSYRDAHVAAGLTGQALYVRATELGLVASGLGCFLDDEATTLFGQGRNIWPLYSFAVGAPSPLARTLSRFEYDRDMLDHKYDES
jgi:nitroreductase